jgi:signal transduction histidine kinase
MVGMSLTLQSLLAQQQPSLTIERELVEAMWHSCQRQQRLIDALVESPESHWQGKERNWVSLTQLIEELRLNWQPVIASHGAAIEYRISQDLPPVWSDKNQIWRVFENLIGNALKHNGAGVNITVEATYEQGSREVQCTVADDGVGIAVEQIPQLFKPYATGEKADSPKGQKLGADWGLGLYICRQIVERQVGQISVESRPGKGAKFCFTLPITPTV